MRRWPPLINLYRYSRSMVTSRHHPCQLHGSPVICSANSGLCFILFIVTAIHQTARSCLFLLYIRESAASFISQLQLPRHIEEPLSLPRPHLYSFWTAIGKAEHSSEVLLGQYTPAFGPFAVSRHWKFEASGLCFWLFPPACYSVCYDIAWDKEIGIVILFLSPLSPGKEGSR